MPRYIDESEILKITSGGKDIFAYYYPSYDFGNRKAFIKLREGEKTASALISYYNGQWRITDFGNQSEINSMNAIGFVAWKENLVYYEALLFIEQVIIRREVSGSGYIKPIWRAEYSSREMSADDKKGAYTFVYKEHASQHDLEAIGPFVSEETLDWYNCRVVDSYEYCTYSKKLGRDIVHIFKSTKDYPIFVFDYGDFKKLYRPHEMEKKHRFSYIGEKPKDYIYGLHQLQGSDSEFVDDDGREYAPSGKPLAKVKDLFRCSGESDALNMSSLGFHVYWLNSESADFREDHFKQLDDLCENHYQVLDLDKTGEAMATKNALRHIDLFSLTLPEWLTTKKDFRGNPCKDIKDFIAQYDTQSAAEYAVKVRKQKARKVKFWEATDKGYNLNFEYIYHLLQLNGFYQYRYSLARDEEYCFVRITGQTVEIISPKQIKRVIRGFLREWIQGRNLMSEIAILNKLNTSAQISEGTLDSLNEINISFDNHSATTEYLHFKNCSLRITPDSIDRIKHDDIPNYILGSIPVKGKSLSHVIDFNLSSTPDYRAIEVNATPEYASLLERRSKASTEVEVSAINAEINDLCDIDRYTVTVKDNKFIFAEFIRDLARIHWRKEIEDNESLTDEESKQEQLSLANLMFCMGYLGAQYKDAGKPWVVFLQDTRDSEVGKSNGRSGKSLISKALRYIRNSYYVGGRELKDQSKYQFIYDGYTEFHSIIEIDDMSEHADFDFFYTQVTGSRTINSKNISPITLEYEKSGKMIISTNYEMPNTDSSTLSRMLNAGLSDYYHEATKHNDYLETRSPRLKFNRQLYTDFTQEEWNKFYYFMAYCIQLQMRFDKIEPFTDNLDRRQYRKIMASGLGRGEHFLNWANDFFQHWDSEDSRPEYSEITQYTDDVMYFNTYLSRTAAFQQFQLNAGVPDTKLKGFSAHNFKQKLDAWCAYNGYELNPADKCTDPTGKRILRKRNGKTVEYFYISTLDQLGEPPAEQPTRVEHTQTKCPF